MSDQCTCEATYAKYEGPHVACPVHGAIKALNEAFAVIERLRGERDAQTRLAAGLAEERDRAWRERYRFQGQNQRGLDLISEFQTYELYDGERDRLDEIRARLEGQTEGQS